MFKYKNDICEYIRLNAEALKQEEKESFKQYLNNNNLVLINKKTLKIINTLEEVDDLLEELSSDKYCQSDACFGVREITCVNCLLDYMLTIDYLQLVKKENKHASI